MRGRRVSGVVYLPTSAAPQRALVRRQIEVGPRTLDRIVGGRYDWRDGDWAVREAVSGPAGVRPDREAEGHQAAASTRVRDISIGRVDSRPDGAYHGD